MKMNRNFDSLIFFYQKPMYKKQGLKSNLSWETEGSDSEDLRNWKYVNQDFLS